MFLVIGGDGLIGSSLVRHLREAGEPVLATTRRPGSSTEPRIALDLSAVPADWDPPAPACVTYLCAGTSSIEACRRDPDRTRHIDVEAPLGLARRLVAGGSHVVGLSTNQVLDGSQALAAASTAPAPRSNYGRNRAALEGGLLTHGKSVAVLRLSKVVGGRLALLDRWAVALSSGQDIRPFDDMVMSPVPLDTVSHILHAIGTSRSTGIFQVSGERDVTFEEVACRLVDALGLPRSRVKAAHAKDVLPDLETNPAHTTLDCSRVVRELGIEIPPVDHTIDDVIQATIHGRTR